MFTGYMARQEWKKAKKAATAAIATTVPHNPIQKTTRHSISKLFYVDFVF